MTTVTIESVLSAWRSSICFGDEICVPDGRKGNVCGKNESGKMIVILDPMSRDRAKIETTPDEVFPGWWPRQQFEKPKESSR